MQYIANREVFSLFAMYWIYKRSDYMAITSPSQILSVSAVQSAVNILDTTISHLNNAKSTLSTAVNYCDTRALETNEGNTFPSRIKQLQDQIDARISEINTMKAGVMEVARRINKSENYQYQQYLAEQERIRQEAEAAAKAASEAASRQSMTA